MAEVNLPLYRGLALAVDVLPSLFRLNPRNVILANAESGRDFWLTACRVEDGQRIGRRNLCGPALLSFDAAISSPFQASTLGGAIPGIVQMRSQKKMSRVYTCSRVAAVTNQKPGGDGAVGNLPSHAVGSARLTFKVYRWIAPDGGRPAKITTGQSFGDRMVIKSLGKRPVRQDAGWCRGIVSHLPAPFQRRVVRAETVLQARFRPASFSKNCRKAQRLSGDRGANAGVRP